MTWWLWVLLWTILVVGAAGWIFLLGRRVWRVGLSVMAAADAALDAARSLSTAFSPDRA